jgi:hypothetical protein
LFHPRKKAGAFPFYDLVYLPDDVRPALGGGNFWWFFKPVLTLK